jgi:hypothetical protein
VDSPYYFESELCVGAVTVSSSKYLPWQAMHFLQRSTHFSKTCCRPFAASFERIVEQAVSCLGASFLWFEKPRNRMGVRSGLYGDVLMGFHPSRWAHPLPLYPHCGLALSWRLLRRPKKGSFEKTVTQTLTTVRGMKITPLLRYPHHCNLA